jgi:mono/diheme cytochrome c family protein
MTISKLSKALILFAILALAGAVVAGCGGSGGSTASGQGSSAGSNAPETTQESKEEEPAEAVEEEAPAEEEPAEEEKAGGEEAGAGESSLVAEGKTVFTTNCGSCHTLAEAGTSGKIGPNLDELEPDLATVEHQVINGGGPMPAFGKDGLLNPKEVKAVATYVSSVAGSG